MSTLKVTNVLAAREVARLAIHSVVATRSDWGVLNPILFMVGEVGSTMSVARLYLVDGGCIYRMFVRTKK